MVVVDCQLCGVLSSEAQWAQYGSGRRPLGEQCELCFYVRMLWCGRLSFPQLVARVDFSHANSLHFCKRRLALERLVSSMWNKNKCCYPSTCFGALGAQDTATLEGGYSGRTLEDGYSGRTLEDGYSVDAMPNLSLSMCDKFNV